MHDARWLNLGNWLNLANESGVVLKEIWDAVRQFNKILVSFHKFSLKRNEEQKLGQRLLGVTECQKTTASQTPRLVRLERLILDVIIIQNLSEAKGTTPLVTTNLETACNFQYKKFLLVLLPKRYLRFRPAVGGNCHKVSFSEISSVTRLAISTSSPREAVNLARWFDLVQFFYLSRTDSETRCSSFVKILVLSWLSHIAANALLKNNDRRSWCITPAVSVVGRLLFSLLRLFNF